MIVLSIRSKQLISNYSAVSLFYCIPYGTSTQPTSHELTHPALKSSPVTFHQPDPSRNTTTANWQVPLSPTEEV